MISIHKNKPDEKNENFSHPVLFKVARYKN